MNGILRDLLKPIFLIVGGWIAFALPIPIISTIIGSVLLIIGIVFLFTEKSELITPGLRFFLFAIVLCVTPYVYISGVALYFSPSDKNSKSNTTGAYTLAPTPTPTPTPAPAPAPVQKISIPGDQMGFKRIIDRAKESSDSASNELGRKQAEMVRNKEICSLLGNGEVRNWKGRVRNIGATGDGHGYISINIFGDYTIKTSNNAFSDSGHRTLIKDGSNLFNVLLSLNSDDLVEFSGVFVRSGKSCVYESSLTLEGSLRNPDFIFRFSDINKQ